MHFKNSFSQGKKLPVYFFYYGNDISFDIISFDMENYEFVFDVRKNVESSCGLTVKQVPPLIRYNFFLHKRDISFFDVIKIFFLGRSNKKIKLNNKTKSNIIRVLKNNQII